VRLCCVTFRKESNLVEEPCIEESRKLWIVNQDLKTESFFAVSVSVPGCAGWVNPLNRDERKPGYLATRVRNDTGTRCSHLREPGKVAASCGGSKCE
jgi:hypothetical protein